jgi:hypothetical protein
MRISSVLITLVGFALVGCGGASASDESASADAVQGRSLNELNWAATAEADWDIVPAIQAFQAEIPEDVADRRAHAAESELGIGISWAWQQDVSETVDGEPQEMAVELSTRRIPVRFSAFAQQLPAAKWGSFLAHRLGGAVKVYASDPSGRPVRQVERMVLSALPCDASVRMLDNDMTKVETIDYGKDRTTVYWRVRHSDNKSTASDVGSVTFQKHGEDSTLVTFHSAHRLRALGMLPIPALLVMPGLQSAFLDHLAHYAERVR